MTDEFDSGLPDEPGTYALLLRANVEQTIEVGALGEMAVRPGVYVYVGSAFGPGGLRARIQRHARGDGALHWHVDYLRAVTTLTAVWYTHDETRRECIWAQVLRQAFEARIPTSGFGASDCDCPTHLGAFDRPPPLSSFRTSLRSQCPSHAPVEQMTTEAKIE